MCKRFNVRGTSVGENQHGRDTVWEGFSLGANQCGRDSVRENECGT